MHVKISMTWGGLLILPLKEDTPASITLLLAPKSYHTLDPQLLTRHLNTLNPIQNLLRRHLPRKVWAPMLQLNINAKRTEATIIRRPNLITLNILTHSDQILTDLLRCLHSQIQRVIDT